jgi:hypothetical protein
MNKVLPRLSAVDHYLVGAQRPEQAAEAARKQFAGLEGIRDWEIHASLIEVEAIDLEAEPETPSLNRRA